MVQTYDMNLSILSNAYIFKTLLIMQIRIKIANKNIDNNAKNINHSTLLIIAHLKECESHCTIKGLF